MARQERAAGRPDLAALRDRLTEVIAPVTERAGFDLERVAVSRLGRRHSVQVVVDRDGGVGLDAIAEVSRAVSEALDAAEDAGTTALPGEYVLEVSSPGVDRPLTEPRHWRRNIGRLVTVRATAEGTVTGRIAATTDEGVVLEIDGTKRTVPYGGLGPGRIQVELRHVGDDQGEGERM
jgi:ribosome maturation factor RimP